MPLRSSAAKVGVKTGAKAGMKTGAKTGMKTGRKTGVKAGSKLRRRTEAVKASARSRPKAPARWRGEAVEPTGPRGQSAEQAAARAEGNAPVRADVAARRRDSGTFLERGPRRQPARGSDDAENVEEKRQSAAEDHHDRGPGLGPIRGRL